jgi:hypothetical protein
MKPFLAYEELEEEEEFVSEICDGEDTLSHEDWITKTQDDNKWVALVDENKS